MVFIVFRCAKCGKGTYTETKKGTNITKKNYKCNRCGKSSSYSKTKIYRMVEHITDAVNVARRADLNHIEELSLEEKKILAAKGEQYMKREFEKKDAERESARKSIDITMLKAENPDLDNELEEALDNYKMWGQKVAELKQIKKLIEKHS